jgi:cell division transport system permease protein
MTHGRMGWFFAEAMKSLRSNFATTLAAVVTVLIVLYLFGIGAALGSYIFSYTEQVRGDVNIKVWVSDNAKDSELHAIQARLATDPRVDPRSVKFVTKDQALAEAKAQFSSQTLKFLAGNPFPARFQVKAKNPDQSASIASSIAGMKGLEPSTDELPNPDYGARTADKVLSTAGVIEAVIAGIAVVLGIAAVLLIGNTIRLSIFARRREVEVMKLVGATNWFVRWPFMLEGMICGVFGAIGAAIVLFISYEALRGYFETNTLSGQGGTASALAFWQLAILLVIAGLGLGAAGSGLTMRKFLRV